MSVEGVNKNLSSLKESAVARLEPGYCSERDTCGRGSSGLQLGVCRLSYDGAGVPKSSPGPFWYPHPWKGTADSLL